MCVVKIKMEDSGMSISKNIGSRVKIHGLKLAPLAEGTWESYLTSLSLSELICKVIAAIVSTTQGCFED